ncbi:cupin domain-containing protein [Dyadobacter sp. CY323]|uniref:cupin domain-containing protein n=1 Tax=Dyadobacter sp. CY323 TaxID=2907302 RepID=UPI001F193754|nr:cupin domain-containing protein [Dyadobacter sp. CY323]MCE6987591.1 cupin domain-containing protein [Dyadobacter sp. CY323]
MESTTIKKKYPVTIDNGHGEQLTFLGREVRDGVEYVRVENQVSPGSGPPMHVHHQQHESLHILEGKMGIEVRGEQPFFLNEGQSATFKAGIAHRFWNAGTTTLRCTGEIWPPYNIEYFLGEVYRSSRENGGGRPAAFDAAYLLSKYRSEFDMLGIPAFVKKVIFPVVLFIGKLRGWDGRFKGAPEAQAESSK